MSLRLLCVVSVLVLMVLNYMMRTEQDQTVEMANGRSWLVGNTGRVVRELTAAKAQENETCAEGVFENFCEDGMLLLSMNGPLDYQC